MKVNSSISFIKIFLRLKEPIVVYDKFYVNDKRICSFRPEITLRFFLQIS